MFAIKQIVFGAIGTGAKGQFDLQARLLQDLRVCNGDKEQCLSGARGGAAAQLPVLQCSRRNTQKLCKGLLGQPHFGACFSSHWQLDLRRAGSLAVFHLLDGFQQITLEFFDFRRHFLTPVQPDQEGMGFLAERLVGMCKCY